MLVNLWFAGAHRAHCPGVSSGRSGRIRPGAICDCRVRPRHVILAALVLWD